eukprot:CAMPEP_0172876894 /NCGR_PEP_ID=MMETSP1075-20121228/105521_1 /TAXON_ID=2916 /ORGANISM="Ceratium fusus, Strain PA161109" /LENGTH=54 /DNA_ID=CAMNT_0013728331 /DNA_START=113 /DNA_END=274 /DNA_ORIENTATION=+
MSWDAVKGAASEAATAVASVALTCSKQWCKVAKRCLIEVSIQKHVGLLVHSREC